MHRSRFMRQGTVMALMVFTSAMAACTDHATREMTDEVESVAQALDTPGGTIDPTFGTAGRADPQPACCQVWADGRLSRQSDGKLLLASNRRDEHDWGIMRLTADGAVDTTFGNGGVVITNFQAPPGVSFQPSDTVHTVHQAADGKIVGAGNSQVFNGPEPGAYTLVASFARYNADGSPDLSFGTNGQVQHWPGRDVSSSDMVVLPDGSIIAAGDTRDTGDINSIYVVKLDPNGNPDPTFGVGGVVLAPFPGYGYLQSAAMVRQPNGSIVVTGFLGGDLESQRRTIGAYRLLPNGTFDPTFGTAGYATILYGNPDDSVQVSDVVLQADGKLVVVGGAGRFREPALGHVLVRFNANGTRDTSFGTNGIVTTPYGAQNSAHSVLVQADGKIVTGGEMLAPSDEFSHYSWALTRYNSNGSLDPTFGYGGKVTIPVDVGQLLDVILQPDGKIVGAGTSSNGLVGTLMRFLPGNRTSVSDFDQDNGGFTYQDDTFKGTNKPVYAAGARITSGGFNGGALRVRLGNVDENDILNMSGGWRRTITLPSASRVYVTFRYNVVAPPNLEPDEYAQVMASIDGSLRSPNGADEIAQLNGAEGGEGGPNRTTGWQLVTLDLGNLAAGNHTLILGGFANKKTAADEYSDVLFDDVAIATDPATGLETVFSENFNAGAGGFTYADDQFHGTTQPAYASGVYTATGGNTGGGVTVTVGGVNDNVITNMSGGWRRTVTVGTPIKSGALHFKFRHVQQPNYEATEFTQMAFSVDGVVTELPIGKITGNGEGGPAQDSGWVDLVVSVGAIGDGTHTIVLGAYNNRKSNVSESATITFDDVTFSAQY
jgi:uncharacterized delta-60 repeat protein